MDKMREEFEAWATNVYGTARMGVSAGFYSRDEVQGAWQAWQASREEVVVELPKLALDGVEVVEFYVGVIKALDAAGVSYK